MKVWAYWECPYCESLIKGKYRVCPNCGSPVPNDTKYLMPDNPKVIKALKDGTVITKNDTHVDEKGVISEIVKPEEERKNPNWLCPACGYQNFNEADTCESCGYNKTSKTYFGDNTKSQNNEPENNESFEEFNTVNYSSDEPKNNESFEKSDTTEQSESNNSDKSHTSFIDKITNFIKCNAINIAKIVGIVFAIALLIWLFMPINREAKVESFSWKRLINVEQYTLCHESDWYVPSGATVTSRRQEIHHYDKELDHYETKSRQVSERVFDGYDTSYKDLGNGQAEVVETPRYRTEYHTEYYEEPVYIDVPVYRTKYYYDIGRWKHHSYLETKNNNKEPYWYDTDLPTNIENPEYGDLRQTTRTETYTVHLIKPDGEKYSTNFAYEKWLSLRINDLISYKSFRFTIN